MHLAATDYAIPFHLSTDASEDGKGATLCQLPTVPVESQHPYSARTHSPDNMAIISFFSKAWNESQANRPPFYLEADGLLWAMDKSKFYALSSPFPLFTHGAATIFLCSGCTNLKRVQQANSSSSSSLRSTKSTATSKVD